MPITKTDVLDVLEDRRIRNIRFSAGPINVNSDEYDTVSDYIESEAITVTPGKETLSRYIPLRDTLMTRVGNPPLDYNARTNILHECTHIISDIHKYNVGRLVDEVAAYLAQIAYLFILLPSLEEPPIGPPLNNMMRQGMQLVRKYHLGEPAGYGAIITQSDISDFARAIHAIPDYSNIGMKETLDVDGVASSLAFLRLQLFRMTKRYLDEDIAKDIEQRLVAKVRGVSYENYVMSDSELLALFDSYRGGGAQKETALQRLIHIFLTIDQPSAVRLLQRLSTPSNNDVVSNRFLSGLSLPDRSALLAALRLTR
jgi:hypothetical protein